MPQPLQDMFNAFGGGMPADRGVPVEEIVRAASSTGCVRMVNIDTGCRLAATAVFRKNAVQTKTEFDPRKFLKPAMTRRAISAASASETVRRAPALLADKVIPLARHWRGAT